MRDFNEILKDAVKSGASDIHLSAGAPVAFRIDARLTVFEEEIFTSGDMERLLSLFLTGEMAVRLKTNGELSIVYHVEQTGRFRINLFKKNGALAAAIRVFKETPPFLDDLNAPSVIKELIRENNGIIIVGSRAGNGRSTTLSAMINEINITMSRHLVSIEENIEYPLVNMLSVIDQRKLLEDTQSYRAGIKAAIREDADIIVLSDIDDRETMDEAFYAAESGKLIIASIGVPDTVYAIKRILDLYEPERVELVRERLAETLCAVSAQTLIPAEEGGRVAAYEMLIMNKAVKNLLREGKYGQITAIMQADHRFGMMTMDDNICELCLMKQISKENALLYARDRAFVEERLNAI